MSETQSYELPVEIDPKKLVEQEGPNKGNIADVELAQTGAEAHKKEFEEWDTQRLGRADHDLHRMGDYAGEQAMQVEIGRRVAEVTPDLSSPETKQEIENVAQEEFINEQRAKSDEREKEIEDELKAQDFLQKKKEAEDELKAQELLQKLKDSRKQP